MQIVFSEFDDDGLGVCKYCTIRADKKLCILESHPEGPEEAQNVAVLVLSYEDDWDAIIQIFLNELKISRNSLPWVQTEMAPCQWILYRIDDNKNEAEMHSFPDEQRAKWAQNTYEKRGHKQTYFIKRAV